MLTPIWSVEHVLDDVYTRPAALSVLLRFCFISVQSNAQEQILSKSSLPNVQGEVHLSPRCRLSAVLCPRVPANLFTTFRLKLSPSVSIGLHPFCWISCQRICESLRSEVSTP
jgi:hypothetical protein